MATLDEGSVEGFSEASLPVRAKPEDKLRIIRDIVDGQSAFGSELANFQRRLRLILDLE